MNFVQRAINLVAQPKNELTRAAAEPATPAGLIGGYAVLLAALPAIGSFLGMLISYGRYFGSHIVYGLISIIILYALRDIGLTVLMGVITAALAPNFGGQRNSLGATKLAIYAATPIWVMGFLGGLLTVLVPELHYLLIVIGFGYAGFLIYLGCGPMLGIPNQQAPAVAAIVTIIWLVLYVVLTSILTRLVYL